MCGRYTVSGTDIDGLRQRFGLDERVVVRQRFNVAPGDDVLTVTPEGGTELRWGYLKDNAYTTINARAESLMEKPTWRNALHDGRCLIVADGFFEWQRLPDGSKQPFWITRADHAPFAFAGLASPWGTCAIVTTAAAPGIAEIHARMPVMLEQGAEDVWLAPETPATDAFSLLEPFDDVDALPVSSAVNNARYDGPECLTPAPPPPETLF